MSIDGRGGSLSRQAQDRISALVSKLERAEQTIQRLRSRIAYLEAWKEQAEQAFEKAQADA